MVPWDDFDSIFSFNRNFSYDVKVIDQILSNRRALENRLFADRLLGLLQVKAGIILWQVWMHNIMADFYASI